MAYRWFGAAAGLMLLAGPSAAQAPAPLSTLVRSVDIPYEEFTLANGLRVLVHTDRKAPIVSVNMWYGVGSKDEPKERTGFAHLFEHLMFGGSQHVANFDKPLEDAGGNNNGSTWFDRTNYYETAPTPALELMLFLESDRMGWLLPAVTQAKLDAQRGVVQNEKRQGDNEPYGLTEYAILEGLFPEGHPYRHSTIGSMADLDAASLEDVKTWFRTHYGPNNAVLVLAGDIDAKTARPLVDKYFGNIPRGPAGPKLTAGVPRYSVTRRETMRDQVATTRLHYAWATPGRLTAQAPLLDMATTILADGNTSRFYNDLVRDRQIAVGVNAATYPFLLANMTQLTVDVKPGVDAAVVEKRVDELMAAFLKDGPTADEVARVATRAVSGTVRSLERVGGFGGKATALAEGELYADDPQFFKAELQRYATATPDAIRDIAREWLARGDYRLTVVPGPRTAADEAKAVQDKGTFRPRFYRQDGAKITYADRSKLPEVKGVPDLVFPDVERAKLSNGIEVTFARRSTIPVVQMSVVFDAGIAADPKDRLGLATLTSALLDEGTTTRSSVKIAEEAERLGAILGAGSSLDSTRVALSALKPNLARSIDLFADVVRNPVFDPKETERVRTQLLTRIAAENTEPQGIAQRSLPPLLYGADHPYGVPFTGSGTPEGVKAIGRADLIGFQQRWMRPDNARIFVVGDTTLAEVLPLLEARFGNWRAPDVAKGSKAFRPVAAPAAGRIILIDRPNSPQSLILAGQPLPLKGTDDPLALATANDALGGTFTSRLNMDLRETKAWAYGVSSMIQTVREQMPFLLYAPVQTDRTGDSIAAILGNVRGFVGEQPITPEELVRTINNNVRSLPGGYETAGSVLGALESNASLKRPDDYQVKLPERLRTFTAEDLTGAAKRYIDPSKLVWVVVGDRAKVEPQLKKLGLPVEVRSGR